MTDNTQTKKEESDLRATYFSENQGLLQVEDAPPLKKRLTFLNLAEDFNPDQKQYLSPNASSLINTTSRTQDQQDHDDILRSEMQQFEQSQIRQSICVEKLGNTRRKCYGCCILGPKETSCQPIVANLIVFISLIATSALLFMDDWQWLVYSTITLLALTQILMLYMTLSDFGSVKRVKSGKGKSDLTDPLLQKKIEQCQEDQVLDIYKQRWCKICKQAKPPLASHCQHCNVCVEGYDHHCTLLNKCIGKQNLTPFIALLATAFVAHLCMALLGICFIFVDDMVDKSWEKIKFSYNSTSYVDFDSEIDRGYFIEFSLDMMILILVSVKFWLWLFRVNRMSFEAIMLWIVLELILVELLCSLNWRDVSLNLTGFLMCMGTSGVLLLKSLVTRQIYLAFIGETFREYLSKQASNDNKQAQENQHNNDLLKHE